MFQYLIAQYYQNRILKYLAVFFVCISLWWVTIFFRDLKIGYENDLFTLIYPVISLVGGIYGWIVAKKWGGFKSKLGSAIALFSFGLLAQFLGQVLYNSYIYILGIEVPYPSWGDVSFFASVVFYVFASIQLAKVAGMKMSLSSVRGKLQAFVIPLVILLISYIVFLQGYIPDWTNKIVVFLDFGYPIGQAIYVSIAILTLLISKDILGGLMRKPLMLLIIALIFQYLADFTFSYQVSRETWYVGGINDYLFCISYFLMALSLFSIGNMFYKVQQS